ncbi:MAG: hypothetical protein QM586_07755 [Xenophilus sp.]
MQRCLAVLALLAVSGMAAAAHPCDGGKLSRLVSYTATYDAARLLAEPAVAAQIKLKLGKEAAKLHRNLGVVGPVELRGCALALEGNAPHQGGEEHAYLEVNLFSGEVSAGILSGGHVALYAGLPRYDLLSAALRDWATVAASGFRYRMAPPPNTRLHAGGQ